MDDGLGMDDNVDIVVAGAEEVVGFDDLCNGCLSCEDDVLSCEPWK